MRERSQRRSRLDTRPEWTPKNNLRTLRSWLGDRAGRAPTPTTGGASDGIAVVGSATAVGSAATSGTLAGTWEPEGVASTVTGESWGPDGTTSAPASSCTVGADAAGTPSAAADGGGLGTDTDGAMVAVGRSPVTFPADVCWWGLDPPAGMAVDEEGASMVAVDGSPATFPAGVCRWEPDPR
jgi:hypothetical protein